MNVGFLMYFDIVCKLPNYLRITAYDGNSIKSSKRGHKLLHSFNLGMVMIRKWLVTLTTEIDVIEQEGTAIFCGSLLLF